MIVLFIFADSWVTLPNFLIGLTVFVLAMGGLAIGLFYKRGETVTGVQIQRADANEALVKTRDIQLADKDKLLDKAIEEKDECKEELEATTTELRGQMGINIDELMRYWQIRDTELARKEELEDRVRVLEARLKLKGEAL